MANKKFSEFELKTTTSDVSHIVGYNGAENVQITPANFVTSGGTGVFLPLAGGTMVGNTIHNDNVKSIYGTSGDGLEIFHDGSNNHITDSGTGELLIRTNLLAIQNAAGTENMAKFNDDSDVKLYFNDAQKFATTSTGISVTGSAFFNRDGTNGTIASPYFENIIESGIETTNASSIQLGNSYSQNQGSLLRFRVNSADTASTPINALTLDSSSATFAGNLQIGNQKFLKFGGNGARIYGDSTNNFLTFDTNSAERMRLDASGNLGIGTSSPTEKLTVESAAGFIATFKSLTASDFRPIRFQNAAGNDVGYLGNNDSTDEFFLRANDQPLIFGSGNAGTEKMRLSSAGEIQFGTGSNNGGFLDFDGTSVQLNTQRNPNTGAFVDTAKSNASINLFGANGGSSIRFSTANANNTTASERMRIDSSGVLTLGSQGSTVLKTTITENDKVDLNAGDGTNAASSRNLTFSTGNSERMRLTSAGALLIGTTSGETGALLQVQTSTNAASYITQKNTNSGASAFTSFKQFTDSGQSEYWRNSSAATGGNANSQNIYNSNGVINLWTNGVQNLTLQTDGDLELLTNNKGLILKSANGTAYRITVADNGTVTSTAV